MSQQPTNEKDSTLHGLSAQSSLPPKKSHSASKRARDDDDDNAAASASAAKRPAQSDPPIRTYLEPLYPARARHHLNDDSQKLHANHVETPEDLFVEFQEVCREQRNFISHLQQKYGISQLARNIARDMQGRSEPKKEMAIESVVYAAPHRNYAVNAKDRDSSPFDPREVRGRQPPGHVQFDSMSIYKSEDLVFHSSKKPTDALEAATYAYYSDDDRFIHVASAGGKVAVTQYTELDESRKRLGKRITSDSFSDGIITYAAVQTFVEGAIRTLEKDAAWTAKIVAAWNAQ